MSKIKVEDLKLKFIDACNLIDGSLLSLDNGDLVCKVDDSKIVFHNKHWISLVHDDNNRIELFDVNDIELYDKNFLITQNNGKWTAFIYKNRKVEIFGNSMAIHDILD